MQHPLVSIVVPIFRIEKFLPNCIDSIISQKYKNIEIILVNDGSDDQCPEICDSYAKNDPRIRVLHQDNSGLVEARKSGSRIAAGKYITFVDGDDWILDHHIQELVESIGDSDLCITSFQKDFLGKRSINKNYFKDGVYEKNQLDSLIFPEAISAKNFFCHGVSTYYWNKLFITKKLIPILENADKEIIMGEDSCVVFPYIYSSSKIVFISRDSYVYRQRQDSIIKTPKNVFEEFKRLSKMFISLSNGLSKKLIDYELKRQINEYFIFSIFTRTGGILDLNGKVLDMFLSKEAQKILLVSTGSLGQIMHAKLKKYFPNKIVGWIDEDFEESIKSGLDVVKQESTNNIDYECVLIASLNQSFINSWKKKIALNRKTKFIKLDKLTAQRFAQSAANVGFDLENYTFRNSD